MTEAISPAVPQAKKPQKILIAVHGIGDQLQCSTIQQVTHQLYRFYGERALIPIGQLHAKIIAPPPEGPLDHITLMGEIKSGIVLGEIPVAIKKQHGSLEPFVPVFEIDSKIVVQGDIKFAVNEIYWADIARRFANEGYSLEDTKAWGRTIVSRVKDRTKWLREGGVVEQVVPQIIEGIHVLENIFYICDKAFGIKFDLAKVLRDYVGDVQQVAEFENIRSQILNAFQDSLRTIYENNPDAEIYFFAHSEGSVVTLLALLTALNTLDAVKSKSEDRDAAAWVRNVRGLMTIGSPIDKHLFLWRELFQPFEMRTSPADWDSPPIKWQNYYDFGDPVGFNLDEARKWLDEHGWKQCFEFDDNDDFGFARYTFPGKAHLDYFKDNELFDHFFQNTVNLKPTGPHAKKSRRPRSRPFKAHIATGIPYLLSAAVLSIGIYLFYSAASVYLPIVESAWDTTRNVIGITILIWGLVLAASIVRATHVGNVPTRRWQISAYTVALVGVAIGYQFVTDGALLRGYIALPEVAKAIIAREKLPFIPIVVMTASLLIPVIAVHLLPRWRRWLCGCGIVCAVGVLGYSRFGDEAPYEQFWHQRVADHPTRDSDLCSLRAYSNIWDQFPGRWSYDEPMVGPSAEPLNGVASASPPPQVWPLIIGSAMLFYLWWITSILLDLTIVWHMYIRFHTVIDARKKASRAKSEKAKCVKSPDS